MFAKISIALAILIALSAGAVAAQKRHQGAAGAYGAAPPTALCWQPGPVTLAATNPVCNRHGWFED
jgi:hypothetical protein